MLKNSATSWGSVSKSLHWGTAVLVLGLWGLGFTMVRFWQHDLGRLFELYQLHKSIGFVVFVTTVLRLVWRLASRRPDDISTVPVWQMRAAKAVHALLYVCLLAMPVLGFLMASASPLSIPTVIFGVLPLPSPIAPDKALYDLFNRLHEIGAWVLASLVAVHISAAIKHHIIDRDETLRRMLRGNVPGS